MLTKVICTQRVESGGKADTLLRHCLFSEHYKYRMAYNTNSRYRASGARATRQKLYNSTRLAEKDDPAAYIRIRYLDLVLDVYIPIKRATICTRHARRTRGKRTRDAFGSFSDGK